MTGLQVLVVTVVHHPEDARIRYRQIPSLVEAGHTVTYAAPFSRYGLPQREGSLRTLDLPRAVGRRRGQAWAAALQLLHRVGRPGGVPADVVLVHDPELAALALAARPPVPVIWDVHEDTAAALSMKAWVPGAARASVARAVQTLERRAERRLHLLLAEEGYQARFTRRHPVVPNTTYVPDAVPSPAPDRVVYVGHITRARGARLMVAVAEALATVAPGAVQVEVVGAADDESAHALQAATRSGVLHWHGFLPNPQAMTMLEGATAGLSLLADEPNYAHSRPTKVIEYLAHGVPVITTPTPLARQIIEQTGAGIVVPYDDVDAVVAAVLRLHTDAALRIGMGQAGHQAALDRYSWRKQAPAFVAEIERVAATR